MNTSQNAVLKLDEHTPSGAPEFAPWSSCYSIFSFICMFCRPLFVHLFISFWLLCCLFFFDIYGFWLPFWYLHTLLKKVFFFLISIFWPLLFQIWLYNDVYVSKRIFFKKNPHKNKWTINNLYPPFLTPLGPLVSFVYFWSTKKNINFVGDHPLNIHTKFGSNWTSGFREED